MEGTFAATPPLESLRYVIHWTATRRRHGVRIRIYLMIMDVSHAHFHPPAVRETYIELPAENWEEGYVGLLLRALCGTRDAAHQFDIFVNQLISAVGYEVGDSTPCVYTHSKEISIGWRHGDDMAFAGEKHVGGRICEVEQGHAAQEESDARVHR